MYLRKENLENSILDTNNKAFQFKMKAQTLRNFFSFLKYKTTGEIEAYMPGSQSCSSHSSKSPLACITTSYRKIMYKRRDRDAYM